MQPLYAFFLVILTGIFSSKLLKKLHLPWVAALIVGGIIAGPSVLGLVSTNETLDFIAELGLIFLMFMAGLEAKISTFRQGRKDLLFLAFVNGFIPFMTGVLIFQILGYSPRTTLLIGTVFVSSSIAVITPTLEANGLINQKFGRNVISAIMLQDVASLLLLSVVLQGANPVAKLPFYLFYPVMLVTITAIRMLIPHTKGLIFKLFREDDIFQHELRVIFLILLGTVIIFDLLGLHTIVGGFFAGLLLSEFISDEIMISKIRALSYGFFIPTFFVVVGLRTDLSVLSNYAELAPLLILTMLGSMVSKLVSGYLGARIIKYNVNEAFFFGAASIPQLSTTLAVAYTAKAFNLINEDIFTALVLLSVVSTFLGPLVMNYFEKRLVDKELTDINLL